LIEIKFDADLPADLTLLAAGTTKPHTKMPAASLPAGIRMR
jgi:hypothetical protein